MFVCGLTFRVYITRRGENIRKTDVANGIAAWAFIAWIKRKIHHLMDHNTLFNELMALLAVR